MSQNEVSLEAARVRWLVAGSFSAAPSGRRFHVTADTFAPELARAASGLRVTVQDRLGGSDTRSFELSFDRLRAFGLAGLLTAVPELRALHALRDTLQQGDPQRTPSPEDGAAKVAAITGPGRLSEAVAEALRGTQAPPPPPPAAPPPTGSSDELVDTFLQRADTGSSATAARAVDAFLKAVTPKSPSAGGAPSAAAKKSARDVLDEALLLTAKDLLAAEPVARLESAWRGLKWLVDQCPASSGMAIEVVDVARAGLHDALEQALLVEPFERPDTCFVVEGSDDVEAMGKLALLGERAQLPVVVAVSSALLGTTLAELPTVLSEATDEVPEAWGDLRQDESSRWLCAVLNRPVMSSEGKGLAKRTCFTSPTFAVAALLAASFRDTGSFARILGQPGGLHAPMTWELPPGRDGGISVPTETFLPIRAQARLEEQGVLGLGSGRNADAVLLAAAPMVYGGGYAVPLPAQLLTGRIVRFAQWVRDQLPAGVAEADVSALFTQAAEVFLFQGVTETGQLRAELVATAEGGRGVQVSATVRPEHAGTRFQLAFTLPLRR